MSSVPLVQSPWLIMYTASTIVLALLLSLRVIVRTPSWRMALAWGTWLALAVVIAGSCWPTDWKIPVPLARSPAISWAYATVPPPPLPIMEADSADQVIPARAAHESPMESPTTGFRWFWSHGLNVGLAAGACLMAMRHCAGWWLTRRLLRQAQAAPSCLQAWVDRHFQGKKRPRVLLHEDVTTAIALGWFQPTVVLAASLGDSVPDVSRGTGMLLAHEVAHIRNGDLKFLAGLRWISIPLWANPLFWLFRRSVQLDQEILADEAASARDRTGYAEQLAAWGCRHSLAPCWSRLPHTGVGHSTSQLRRRIHYLVHLSANLRMA